jgi:hypothetical protein
MRAHYHPRSSPSGLLPVMSIRAACSAARTADK